MVLRRTSLKRFEEHMVASRMYGFGAEWLATAQLEG